MQRQYQTFGTDRYGQGTGMNVHMDNFNFCTMILVVLSHFLHTHNNTDWIYNQPFACKTVIPLQYQGYSNITSLIHCLVRLMP